MTRYLPALALLAACGAQATTLTDSLMRCDSTFFSEIQAQKNSLKNTAPLVISGKHAWFAPQKNGEETTWFTQPVKTQGLTLSGYYLSQSDLEEMGKYYFWGFIIDETPAAVVAAMPQAGWQKTGDTYMASPMIRGPQDKDWVANTTAVSGIAPAKGSIEKLALLEEHNGKTLLTCTVQGAVTDAVLLPLRPDLAGAKS